jgi:hypothetical protein
MLFARDARDAARALDPHHVCLERPLPTPRKDDGLALGLGDVWGEVSYLRYDPLP